MIDEAPTTTIKDAWRQLDALEAQLRAEESAGRTSDRYLALCSEHCRCLLAVVPRAREGMGGNHD